MKRSTLVLAATAFVALLLAGCASPPQVKADAQPPADPREAIATAVATCATAIERIATAAGGDVASRVVAVGAIERMCGTQGSTQLAALNVTPPAPPPSLGQTLWTAALQTADILLRGYGLKMNRDVAVIQSNNQAATSIASYGAFTAMGGAIERAGIAGYAYVQAPGAVTTNTVAGNGVIGSGTYTGPVTTTSTTTTTTTCAGGQAGAGGGTTTPGPGGAGGTVTC